ncbi:hypothetical protein AVEN_51816-1, partial [Araneus ventricosus]
WTPHDPIKITWDTPHAQIEKDIMLDVIADPHCQKIEKSTLHCTESVFYDQMFCVTIFLFVACPVVPSWTPKCPVASNYASGRPNVLLPNQATPKCPNQSFGTPKCPAVSQPYSFGRFWVSFVPNPLLSGRPTSMLSPTKAQDDQMSQGCPQTAVLLQDVLLYSNQLRDA